ncbi:MAG: nucleotidyltransferase [Planctomycetes bacterium]|nr:nucleotidyltransferase [Planctomycetota bacterium]
MNFKKVCIVRYLCTGVDIVVDLILADAKYTREAISNQGKVDIGGKDYPVLSPEDIILFKSLGKREKDIGPMNAVARSNEIDREYIEKWARHLGTWGFVKRALKGT